MPKHLNVRELIAVLQTLPPDALVHTEGCDCVGPCDGAALRYNTEGANDGLVVLTRNDDLDRDEY